MTEFSSMNKRPGNNDDPAKKEPENNAENANEGYPQYGPAEDIYTVAELAADVDPENPAKAKTPNADERESGEEQEIDSIDPGAGLDVPGSELDDEEEKTGGEDEENNYYSIGGDEHNNLEEDQEVTDNKE